MTKNKKRYWLLLVLTFLASSLLAYLLFDTKFLQYDARVIGGASELLADGQRNYYCDVDNDSLSEEFIYYHLSDNRQPIINQYSGKGEFQNQWNLDGEVFDNFDFMCGDYNNDSLKELYVFAVEKNKLFLHGIQPNTSNQFIFSKVFLCTTENYESTRFLVVHPGKVIDMNNDGYDEIVFSVTSRYNPYPRKVFSYDIHNKKLYASQELNMQLVGNPIIYDINNDNLPEVFLSTLNSTSQTWTLPKENPSYSSSIVLNSELKPLFDPILFQSQMSVSATYPITSREHSNIAVVSWPLKQGEKGKITILNKKGETIRLTEINKKGFVFDPSRLKYNNILLFGNSGEIISYDVLLRKKTITNTNTKINQTKFIDIDNDSIEEIVLVMDNKLAIYTNSFSQPVFIDIPGLGAENVYFSINKKPDQTNSLSIQNGNYQHLISYNKNNLYPLRYLIYLFFGLIAALLLMLSRKLYMNQIDRINQSNQKVMQLQIELMKNQLDPHFLFNALNSISFSINKSDRKTAYYNLGIFSKLMREAIGSMDEFHRTLEDEINYTTHYLRLEKFRFKELFEFNFMLAPGVSKSVLVPKMCLFCYVEAALKKGVLQKPEGGKIDIMIDISSHKDLILTVHDNGLFRNVAKKKNTLSNSIMALNHIITFYNQTNRKKIKIDYIDIGDEHAAKGSKIIITIPNEYNYTHT